MLRTLHTIIRIKVKVGWCIWLVRSTASSIVIIWFLSNIWVIRLKRGLFSFSYSFPFIFHSSSCIRLTTFVLVSTVTWYLVLHIRYSFLDPVLLHIRMSLLIPTISIVFIPLFPLSFLLILIIFIYKCSLSSLLTVDMREALVIYPHLKHLSMLDYVQSMVAYVKRILKWSSKLLSFK